MRIKQIFLILLFCFIGVYIVKADRVSDSLLVQLKKSNQDTIKIRLLNELSAYLVNSNPDSAIFYANKALALAEKEMPSKSRDIVRRLKIFQSESYTNIGNSYKTLGNYEGAVSNYKKSLDIRNEIDDQKGVANNYIDIGIISSNKGNYDTAEEFYKKGIAILEEINDSTGLSKAYRNVGNVFYYMGDPDQAVEFYQKSLVMSEKINDLENVSRCYNNIGLIYKERRLFNWAEEYFNKSLAIKQKLGDKRGIATTYNNLGDVFFDQENYDEALKHYQKSLTLREEIKHKRDEAFSLRNIGRVLAIKKSYIEAEKYYQRSLKINQEIADAEQQSVVLTELASLYYDNKKFAQAIKYAEQAIEIGNQIRTRPRLRDAYEVLAKVYESQNNIPLAFKYYKRFIAMKDSIYRDDEHKLIEKETKYKVDKKQKEIENQRLKREAEQQRAQIQTLMFIIILAAMVLVAFILYRSYKQKTRANTILQEQKKEIEIAKEEIEAQRDLVMEKNEQVLAAKKEIEDSIIYAKNIQHAVLPAEEIRVRILPEHFIFFRPRNIVSGDFYWMKQLKNFVVITIADCTGHGVPGAFMSMLGLMFLNEIVTTRSLDSSGLILNKLREKVKTSLHQSGKEGEAKDGMDISFFVIDTDTLEMQFSGAFNPLYVVRSKSLIEDVSKIENDSIKACYSQNESATAVLFEIKADRQPIAIYSYEKDFTTNYFQLKKGDTIYSFTDGYPDQFGGEEGKKLNAKRFKELFLSIWDKPISEQEKLVEKNFYDWMGGMEQVDDVLLMGLKIS
jgi:tetratricopeptide (TPR) repeat protein